MTLRLFGHVSRVHDKDGKAHHVVMVNGRALSTTPSRDQMARIFDRQRRNALAIRRSSVPKLIVGIRGFNPRTMSWASYLTCGVPDVPLR